MKRLLYLCAFACLVGVGYCALQIANMPDLVGDAIEAAKDHDPSTAEDVDLAKAQAPEYVGHLREGGLYLLGFGALLTLARRVR